MEKQNSEQVNILAMENHDLICEYNHIIHKWPIFPIAGVQ